MTIAEPNLKYELSPAPAWRSRVQGYTPLINEANQAALDELRDVVYGLTLRGANEKDITECFGRERHLVNQQLGPVFQIAVAELRRKHPANTRLEVGLRGDNDLVHLTNSRTSWLRRMVVSAGATAQSCRRRSWPSSLCRARR